MSRTAWVSKMSEDFKGAMKRWREQVDEEDPITIPASPSEVLNHSRALIKQRDRFFFRPFFNALCRFKTPDHQFFNLQGAPSTNSLSLPVRNPTFGWILLSFCLVLLEGSSTLHPIAPLRHRSESPISQEPRLKKRKREEEKEKRAPNFDTNSTPYIEPFVLPHHYSPSVSLESASSQSSATSFSEMSSDPSSPKTDNMDAGATNDELRAVRKRLGKSLNNRVLAHMPAAEFLETFLPLEDDAGRVVDHEARMRSIKRLVELDAVSKESELYGPLAAAFTELSDNKITFRVSANKKDKSTNHRFRPDVMGYDTTDSISDEDETRWKAVDLFVEAKLYRRYDGFQKISFDDLSEKSQETRSQFIHYMDSQWKYQHREYGFCVQFIGKASQIRLLRFDPAGIIISESIHLEKTSEPSKDNNLFAEFLSRFGHVSKRRRGWSPAWEDVNKDERKCDAIKQSLGREPESKTTVNEVTYFTGPRRSPRFFRSRATVGYHATRWVEKEGTFLSCFIKETWPYRIKSAPRRRDAPSDDAHRNIGSGDDAAQAPNDGYRLTEGQVYSKLVKNGVSNIPTLLFEHEHDSTVTDDYVGEDWINSRPPPLTKQVHRILGFKESAKPIHEFSTVREMLKAWMDALSAYKQAIEKADQMHRDISTDNVLIGPNESGLLSDWDQSVGLEEPRAHLDGRTGTVIFMAAELLEGTEDCHHPKHDLQSFYNLLAFLIYFYAPNPLSSTEIMKLMVLYRLPSADPNPLYSLASSKEAEINGVLGPVRNTDLQDGTWGPLGLLLFRLRTEVMFSLIQTNSTITWQDAADKMIGLVKTVLNENHDDLSKGPRKLEGVTLPWEKTWAFRKSVAGSKRARSESPEAVRASWA